MNNAAADPLYTTPASAPAATRGKPGRPRKPAEKRKTARIMVVATPAQHREIKRHAGLKSMSSYLLERGLGGPVRNARLVVQVDRLLGPIEELLDALTPGALITPEVNEQIAKAQPAYDQLRALLREEAALGAARTDAKALRS
jgi:hypothetical protein